MRSVRMMRNAAERSIWYWRSESVWLGATTMLSPVCTPIGSRFSMLQMAMQVSLASRIEEIRLDQVIDCLEGNGAKSRQPDGAETGDSRVLAHVTEQAEQAARDVFASHTLADCLRLRLLEPRVFHGIFHA